MILTLYKTTSSDNTINKVLTNPVDINLRLKSDTDIIRPELILTNAGVDYNDFNYAYIPELERYYFIKDLVIINTKITKLVLECDYLETYKGDILNSESYYKTPIKSGVYGVLDIELTGKENIEILKGSVELVESKNAILSIMAGKWYGNCNF